jgi:hypothetical protein
MDQNLKLERCASPELVLSFGMRVWLIVLLALVQIGSAASAARAQPVLNDRVPLVALIANPSLYDGRYVETFGYLNLEYEGDALYVGKDDFEAFATQNAIWFDGPKAADTKARRALDRHYVHASGTFHAHRNGHLDQWRGTLDVDAVQIAASRRQLSFLYEQRVSPIPLPWPVILALLAGFTALVYGAHAIRRSVGSASSPRPALRVLRGQPRAWTVLVLALSLFIGLRIFGNAQVVFWTPSGNRSDTWFMFSVVECVVGMAGLAAMWAAHTTRRRALCALSVILMLAVPSARELMRMNTWEAQLSYPFRPKVSDYSWSRAVLPQPR